MDAERQEFIDFGRLWRQGRSIGRTLYVMVGADPSKDDRVFGMVDSPEFAAHIVNVHNAWVAKWVALDNDGTSG